MRFPVPDEPGARHLEDVTPARRHGKAPGIAGQSVAIVLRSAKHEPPPFASKPGYRFAMKYLPAATSEARVSLLRDDEQASVTAPPVRTLSVMGSISSTCMIEMRYPDQTITATRG